MRLNPMSRMADFFRQKIRTASKAVNTNRWITTLVVDDDEFVLQSFPELITREPTIEVVGTAVDGMDALEKLKSSHPRLVLMDVRMPLMGGVETAEIIRSRFPDVRVVLMSGYDDEGMREAAASCGAAGFLPKMQLSAEFGNLIRKLFPLPNKVWTAGSESNRPGFRSR